MTPGAFAIFLPDDAHQPKVHDGIHRSVRKLVVKVDANLLD
jgi:beta-galactosidase beta subunit